MILLLTFRQKGKTTKGPVVGYELKTRAIS